MKILLKKKKKISKNTEHYKNLSEDIQNKLAEYQKNVIEWGKIPYYNYKRVF